MADAVLQNDAALSHRTKPTLTYGNLQIFGDAAKIHLGDSYGAVKDLLESGSEEDRLTSLRNLLYYDDLDLKRSQLALADVGPQSFSWIKETDIWKWFASQDNLFWVNGKPGSGKSTLMKHMADSKATLIELTKNDGQPWVIVHFFFDYRAGKSMPNRFLGLLRLFLHQLSIAVKPVAARLRDKMLLDMLASDDSEQCLEVLCQVMSDLPVRVCAFIDGLDEYDGDLWDLATRLETLQSRTDMKMCLASRPEPAFESTFETYPSLTMQDHNQHSIQMYAHRKIQKVVMKHPFIDGLFPEDLVAAIVQKAQGVILWVRLVLDDMVRQCSSTTTATHLYAYLDTLPSELMALYERILDRTNTTYHGDIATMLLLLMENDGAMKAMTFFQACEYMKLAVIQGSLRSKHIDFSTHEKRTKALLGNLIDYVRDGNFKKPITVRLLHRSLTTYLHRARWVADHLPSQIQERFPEPFNRRFAAQCLADISSEPYVRDKLFTSLPELFGFSGDPPATLDEAIRQDKHDRDSFDPTNPAGNVEGRLFEHCRIDYGTRWVDWHDLFLHAIDSFFEHASKTSVPESNSSNAATTNWPGHASRLALIHFIRCKKCKTFVQAKWHWKIVFRIFQEEALDVLIHLMHQEDKWAVQQLQTRHLRPSDQSAESNEAIHGPQAADDHSQSRSHTCNTVPFMQDNKSGMEEHRMCTSSSQIHADLLFILIQRPQPERRPHQTKHDEGRLFNLLHSHAGHLTPFCRVNWIRNLPWLTQIVPNSHLVDTFGLDPGTQSTYWPEDFKGVTLSLFDHHIECPYVRTGTSAACHLLSMPGRGLHDLDGMPASLSDMCEALLRALIGPYGPAQRLQQIEIAFSWLTTETKIITDRKLLREYLVTLEKELSASDPAQDSTILSMPGPTLDEASLAHGYPPCGRCREPARIGAVLDLIARLRGEPSSQTWLQTIGVPLKESSIPPYPCCKRSPAPDQTHLQSQSNRTPHRTVGFADAVPSLRISDDWPNFRGLKKAEISPEERQAHSIVYQRQV